jgi:hypothetical protein
MKVLDQLAANLEERLSSNAEKWRANRNFFLFCPLIFPFSLCALHIIFQVENVFLSAFVTANFSGLFFMAFTIFYIAYWPCFRDKNYIFRSASRHFLSSYLNIYDPKIDTIDSKYHKNLVKVFGIANRLIGLHIFLSLTLFPFAIIICFLLMGLARNFY